jgi:cyclopropane fatty-acyl-phospholipid synthase-like methyltransferase
MKNIYDDGTYLNNNPSWHEDDSAWKAKQIVKIIEKNNLNPERICEVGCGAGEILNQLSMQYADDKEYIGYEISAHAIKLCTKKQKPNLKFKLRDILEDGDVYFDILMAIDVFEHVEDYFTFLRKLKDKAEYKIFHIPLDLSVQTVFRASPILKKRYEIGHIHYFTKDTALETLKDTGYQVKDFFYTSGSIELPNRGLSANLLKLPRKWAYLINRDLAVRFFGGFSLLVLAK